MFGWFKKKASKSYEQEILETLRYIEADLKFIKNTLDDCSYVNETGSRHKLGKKFLRVSTNSIEG